MILSLQVVREAIESAGAKLVFLQPYSPDLSPIESLDQALTEIIIFLHYLGTLVFKEFLNF